MFQNRNLGELIGMMQQYGERERRQFLRNMVGGTVALATARALPERSVQAMGIQQDTAELFSRSVDEETFWKTVRQMFPLGSDLVYMNNGGLGPSPWPVIEAVHRQTLELEAISEAGHEILETTRSKACEFFGCEREELGFTRSTTEGMNLVARGLPLAKGDVILMSTHEHPGGAMPWLALAQEAGLEIELFEPGLDDETNLQAIEAALTSKTRVLVLSQVTCTTGLRFPVSQIAQICRARNVIFVVDGAHPPGMMPVNLHELACDFFVCSGHKWLLGPKGTGMMYVRGEMLDRWKPVMVGAYSDTAFNLDRREFEYKREAAAVEYGTRNTAIIHGLGVALDFLAGIGLERIAARGNQLADYTKKRLLSLSGIKLLTPLSAEASSAIVTFQMLDPRIGPWALTERMRKKYSIRIRPVGEHGLNGVRVSLAVYNSMEQVDHLVEALSKEFGQN